MGSTDPLDGIPAFTYTDPMLVFTPERRNVLPTQVNRLGGRLLETVSLTYECYKLRLGLSGACRAYRQSPGVFLGDIDDRVLQRLLHLGCHVELNALFLDHVVSLEGILRECQANLQAAGAVIFAEDSNALGLGYALYASAFLHQRYGSCRYADHATSPLSLGGPTPTLGEGRSCSSAGGSGAPPLADLVLEGGGPVPVGFNDIIRAVSAATGATVVDTFGRLDNDDFVGGQDCLHPNKSGHHKIAEVFRETLR